MPRARCPMPGAAAKVEEDGFDELWLLDPDRTSAMRSGDGVE